MGSRIRRRGCSRTDSSPSAPSTRRRRSRGRPTSLSTATFTPGRTRPRRVSSSSAWSRISPRRHLAPAWTWLATTFATVTPRPTVRPRAARGAPTAIMVALVRNCLSTTTGFPRSSPSQPTRPASTPHRPARSPTAPTSCLVGGLVIFSGQSRYFAESAQSPAGLPDGLLLWLKRLLRVS